MQTSAVERGTDRFEPCARCDATRTVAVAKHGAPRANRARAGSHRKSAGGDHDVGQPKERVEWVATFRQSAIPCLLVPNEVVHKAEGRSDERAHRHFGNIDDCERFLMPAICQSIGRPNATISGRLSTPVQPVSAMHLLLLAVQQFRGLAISATFAAVTTTLRTSVHRGPFSCALSVRKTIGRPSWSGASPDRVRVLILGRRRHGTACRRPLRSLRTSAGPERRGRR